jgi:DNA mismatch endonuclease (patch repair protein)
MGDPAVMPLTAGVSSRMRLQRTRDTAPEIATRRTLHAAGLRFRVQYPVPGVPRRSIDIAFPAPKLAIFIDGCFWHGCGKHRSIPENNSSWWREKIRINQERDRTTDIHLIASGWRVLRFWEHQDVSEIVSAVLAQTRRPAAEPATQLS